MQISALKHIFYVSHTSQFSLFDNHGNVEQRVQILKLLITQCSPPLCYVYLPFHSTLLPHKADSEKKDICELNN